MGIIYIAITVGTGIGPFVGGAIVQHTSWRWIFLLNIPVGGLALLLVVVFLQVNYNKESTVKAKLKRIDYIGNGTSVPNSHSPISTSDVYSYLAQWLKSFERLPDTPNFIL